MATYAIGDLQGCFNTLNALLAKINFDAAKDRLWFVGDLVNRGPGSLECLRFIRQLGDNATVVLGNHDLHLLARAEGLVKPGKHDTLAPILNAPDRDLLLHWLRHQRLLYTEGEFLMVHAGLPPQWDFALAIQLAREVERALRGGTYRDLLANMYGNDPDCWRDDLSSSERQRLSINAMTRMRVVTKSGQVDFDFKRGLADLPNDLAPWFDSIDASFADKTIIFGHWSALGLHMSNRTIGIDTGCAWGRELTAVRLMDRMVFQVPCAEVGIRRDWD